MLNLKLAEAFVDISCNMQRYNQGINKVRTDLGKLPGAVVIDITVRQVGLATILRQINALRASAASPIRLDFRVDRTRASADLNLIMQQARAIRQRGGGTIPIRADLRQWRQAMVQVFTDLNRVRTLANIPVRANTSAAHASLNLLLQQLRIAQAAARGVHVPRGGTLRLGGGGYGGMGAGASFGVGLAQGAGLGYAANPAMMAGNALGRLAIAAAHSSIALETQAAMLRRIAGFSGGQTEAVKQALFGVSTSRGNAASMEDLMGMATIGARMGVADKGGPKGLVEFASALSQIKTVINDMDAEKLADEVGRSLNNFRLGTEYAKGFGSALTALDNVSIASASDILNITQRLGGMGHAVGLSIQETMALASVLKDVGISNEVAGTSFSQIFQKMASKSDKFAQVIGIDTKKFEDAFRKGPLDALGLVIEKLATMDDTVEKMQALDDLGLKGARVSGSLLRLTQVWDRLAGRVKLADKEMQSGQALSAGVAIQANTTEAAITRMTNAFRGLGDAVMKQVNPALKATANDLGNVADAFAKALNGRGQFLNDLGRWIAGGKAGAPPAAPAKAPLPAPPAGGKPPVKPLDEVSTDQLKDEAWAAATAVIKAAQGGDKKALADAEEAQKKAEERLALRKKEDAQRGKQEKAGDIFRALMDAKQGVQGALLRGLVGAGRNAVGNVAAGLGIGEKPIPRTNYSVTMNSAFERGNRIQESILNREAEREREAELAAKKTAENTGAIAGAQSEIAATLKQMLAKMGQAVMGD